ncbi:hypothetical protein L1887_45571 [Cichorium endivia]|nr:hypothetical protein L1887_45571 [Cichorium endivia]
MYIVMDGFDLGIGILFPATQNADDRDVMVNSVAPVWDGNETWLVLGGAALFGAFPLAYAVIVDALTIPLTLMLIGLIFRGVAFEFRFKATPAHRPFWDKAFIGGSILATFTQGMTVGAVINGFTVTGRAYTGGPFDWFTAFNLFCGAGLVVAYALLGSTWLVMKSENALQQRMREVSKTLLIVLLAFIAAINLWTPLAQPAIAARWFTLPNLFYLLPVPALVRAWDQHLAAYYSTVDHPVAGRRPDAKPGLYAGGRAVDHSRYSGLHLLELLRVSRQSSAWGGLSLMQQPVWKRLLWLAIIWGGSVLALAAVSMLFRMLMTAAGFKSH